jgi:adenylylsulfate kinase-like enzyme
MVFAELESAAESHSLPVVSNLHSVLVGRPRLFVVMTGLPASGKTTLGRALSDSLHLPFMDKDYILEMLFDALGAHSPDDRSRLSRASDAVLQSIALASQGAVLASFWRRPRLSSTSGTPSEWLSTLESDAVVEVLCECDPAVAAERFARRQRHAGHFDQRIAEDDLRAGFEQLANQGPLFSSSPVRVNTSCPVDASEVTVLVREAATAQGWRASS